jgi:hypothetical protein
MGGSPENANNFKDRSGAERAYWRPVRMIRIGPGLEGGILDLEP